MYIWKNRKKRKQESLSFIFIKIIINIILNLSKINIHNLKQKI